jgi:hypothetical protein
VVRVCAKALLVINDSIILYQLSETAMKTVANTTLMNPNQARFVEHGTHCQLIVNPCSSVPPPGVQLLEDTIYILHVAQIACFCLCPGL